MKKQEIYVLIACEESQAECEAFRNLGCYAFSCDIQKCKINPAWHIHDDVRPFLDGQTNFVTQDGKPHEVPQWDLIIAHPPCTYLCRSSSVQMWNGNKFNWQRYLQMILARNFFYTCLNAKAHYVAVENPVPMKRANLPRPTCYADPSWYGVKYTKKTCYWLKNLPPLMPELINPKTKCFVRSSRGKYRSRTFPQLAKAIATQWFEYIQWDKHKLR